MTQKKVPLALLMYKIHTFSEITSLIDYILHNDNSILNAQREFENKFKESEIANENDDGQDKYWDYEYLKINEIFPSFFRQTSFIGLYSFLETRLRSLCENLQRLQSYNIKVSDLNGDNYIEKSKKYLKLVVGLDLDDLNTEWTKITSYQKIRNCFVHGSGNIIKNKSKPLKEQDIYSIVKDDRNLEIEHDGTIKISNNEFLFTFLRVIEAYLHSLLDKIKLKFDYKFEFSQ